jgi:hypothetical protein
MPKRTFWLATGVAVGAGSTLWAERKVRRTWHEAAARLQPDAIVVEVGRSARQVAAGAGDRVRDAVWSGREEMQRREEELWSELAAQDRGPEPPPRSPSLPSSSDLRSSDIGRTGRSGRSGRSRMARLSRPRAKSLSYLGN